jgi:hypothetical protein
LKKTYKKRTEELPHNDHDAIIHAHEEDRMFAYYSNDRPSSRPAKEYTSDSDDDLYKNKDKLPIQPYRSNTTHRSTASQSPAFNRRSSNQYPDFNRRPSTNQARSYPPPSNDPNDRTPYHPPDPDPSDSDDEQRKRWRSFRKMLNIQSDDSSDDYIVNTRIQKIDTNVIDVLRELASSCHPF